MIRLDHGRLGAGLLKSPQFWILQYWRSMEPKVDRVGGKGRTVSDEELELKARLIVFISIIVETSITMCEAY
jgi:hypothetical protein